MSILPGMMVDVNLFIAYAFGIILIYLIGRMFLMPVKLVFRLIYNGIIGGVILWIINMIGVHFGFTVPLNPITALVVGFLGLPGVVLLILYRVFF